MGERNKTLVLSNELIKFRALNWMDIEIELNNDGLNWMGIEIELNESKN